MKKLLLVIYFIATVVLFFSLTYAHAQAPPPSTCVDLDSCKAAVSTAYQEIHAADAVLALLSANVPLPTTPPPVCQAKDECGAMIADRFYAAALALGQVDRFAREAPYVGLVITGDVAAGPYAIEAVTNKPNTMVVFQVDGQDFRKEAVSKFCMFGGDPVCAAGKLGAGEHTIRVVLYDKLDPTRVLAETSTTVVEPAAEPAPEPAPEPTPEPAPEPAPAVQP